MSSRLRGWLVFTASKTSISFLPEDRHETESERYPWHSLLADDRVLQAFLNHFSLSPVDGARPLCSYLLDASIADLDGWFDNNIEINES